MPDETEEWKWLGDQVWLDLLEPMLFEDSALADRAAKLWHYLLLEIESGPEGVTNAAVCLENALRLTFPFTTTYQACMLLFQESLCDDFPAQNDSLEVLSEAIVRVKAALRRAERSHQSKRRRGSRHLDSRSGRSALNQTFDLVGEPDQPSSVVPVLTKG